MPGGTNEGVCQQIAETIADTPPFSWLGTKANLQFIMLGLEGAGKTTLLYKLKVPQWKRDDIKPALSYLKKQDPANPCGRDAAYHYEELSSSAVNLKYGIWEIPGNELFMRMWPMFYRYNRMSAVLFVVDAFSKNDDVDKLTQARYKLQFLLNEDELRTAAFVLILNIRERTKEQTTKSEVLTFKDFLALENEGRKDKDMTEKEKAIYEMLGVPEIMKTEAHKERFFTFSCNCADFDRFDTVCAAKWENCLKQIKLVYTTKL